MNLYTCECFYPNLLVITVTLIPIAVGIFYLFNLKKKNIKLSYAVALICFGVVFLSIYILSYVDHYQSIFLAKDTDRLKTVEGTLTNLETTGFWEGRCDKFYVDNTEFMVSTDPLYPGYHRPAVYTGAHKKVIPEITIMASVRRGW